MKLVQFGNTEYFYISSRNKTSKIIVNIKYAYIIGTIMVIGAVLKLHYNLYSYILNMIIDFNIKKLNKDSTI